MCFRGAWVCVNSMHVFRTGFLAFMSVCSALTAESIIRYTEDYRLSEVRLDRSSIKYS